MDSTWYLKLGPDHILLILASFAALLITPLLWRKGTSILKYNTYRPENLYDHQHKAHEGTRTLILPDGRKIGYAQYGDTSGRSIIITHGIFGSRLENALFDEIAKDLNVRIIGLERPGIGLSSPVKTPLRKRKILDHARDVERLAEHLGLEEYGILGVAGGGPYALGCAYALPSSVAKPRLRAAAVVTGLGLRDMSQTWPAWVFFLVNRFDVRSLIKWIFGRAPQWQLHLSDEERLQAMRRSFDFNKAHPADVEVARNPRFAEWQMLYLSSTREAVSQSWEGCLDDIVVLCADPGFRVEDIRADLPVHLWYGTDDTNVSPMAGEEFAQRLRAGGNTNVKLHMQEGQTHGSTQVLYRRQILQDLVTTMGS